IQQRKHNCTQESDLGLDNTLWQLRSRTEDTLIMELPFNMVFQLDHPDSQKTTQGASWFGDAKLSGTITVRAEWQ
ncbi:MAG: hypothetical protein ACRC5A_09935, partial [Enterobacteriaceae bacterium]